MNPTKRKIREDYKDLEIIEIKAEEAQKLYRESIYSEEAKADAFYREHCPPYEE